MTAVLHLNKRFPNGGFYNECARYGVEIHFYETEATSAMIEELRPQIVILATGAKPFLPIEGKENDGSSKVGYIKWRCEYSKRKCCYQ